MTCDKRVDTLGRGALLNIFAAQELKSRQAITEDEITLGLTDYTDGEYFDNFLSGILTVIKTCFKFKEYLRKVIKVMQKQALSWRSITHYHANTYLH